MELKKLSDHIWYVPPAAFAYGPEVFLNINDCVRKEYEGGKEMIVVPADLVSMDIGSPKKPRML